MTTDDVVVLGQGLDRMSDLWHGLGADRTSAVEAESFGLGGVGGGGDVAVAIDNSLATSGAAPNGNPAAVPRLCRMPS